MLAGDYGEAGAVARFAPDVAVYSGHNSYADWGTPPSGTGSVVVVGYERPARERWFAGVEPVTRIDNGVGLDNDEQGRTVWLCRDPLRPWPELWTEIRRVG